MHTPPDSAITESTPSDRLAITIEVTPEQKEGLERLAEQQGVSLEDAVRTAIEREIATSAPNGEEAPEAEPGSFLDGLEHVVDSVDGPSDLSSNPDHMEGYGRS